MGQGPWSRDIDGTPSGFYQQSLCHVHRTSALVPVLARFGSNQIELFFNRGEQSSERALG